MSRRHARVWIVILALLACVSALLIHRLGFSRYLGLLLNAVLALAVLLPLGFLLLAGMLRGIFPERPELTPLLHDRIPRSLEQLDEQFLACGFVRIGRAAQLNTRPRSIVLNYLHAELDTYGTAQTALRGPTAWGLIAVSEGGQGTFETLANPEVDAVPAAQGTLRQVFPHADVATLLAHHREGLAHLRRGGHSFRPASAEALEGELARSILRQRETIRKRPFHAAWTMLRRALTGSYPNRIPIAQRATPDPTP